MSDQSPHFSISLKIEEAKVEYLPPEILIDIVLRLPIKYIITWTSVSKSWNSLIKNPNFISTHLNYNHNHTHLLLLRLCSKELVESHCVIKATDEKEVYSLHLDNEAFDEYTRFDFPFHGRSPNGVLSVVGTCNGLVCLADRFNSYNIFVWNPCIRKYVTLPTPDVISIYTGVLKFMGMPCNGFGFDSKTNDYKVVRVVNIRNKGDWGKRPPNVHVYSLATGKWKMVTAVPPTCVVPEHSPQAFVNGALHWAVFCLTNYGFRNFVLVFDLGDEDFREIMLPTDLRIKDHPFYVSVSVCGESLAAFRTTYSVCCIHVWVMKEYGVLESWTKVLTVGSGGPGVDVPRIFDFLIDEEDDLDAVGFRKSGEVVIKTDEGKLVSIDSESKRIKDLRIRGYGFTFVDPYVESLVLLEKSEGAVSY